MAQPSFEAVRLTTQAPADKAFYEDLLHQMTDAALKEQAARRVRLEQQRKYRAESAPKREIEEFFATLGESDDERTDREERRESDAKFHEWRERQARHKKAALDERFNIGFRWVGGEAGGQYYAPFTMAGFKSETDASGILKLFVATLPKVKNLRSGNSKAYLDKSPAKVLGLDDLMVEGNKANLGLIRIDLDFIFPDWATLNAELHAILDPLGFPMPHIGAGRTRIGGAAEKPHLIWLLPLKDAVRTDAEAFKAPLLLYRAVARALCSALLPLGADPGGLTNPVRVKNPLSPFLTTVIFNESKPSSLREMSKKLDLSISTPELVRRFVVVNAPAQGISPVASNAAFHEFRSACFATLRLWNRVGDSRLKVGDQDATFEELVAHLGHDARHAVHGLKPRDAMAILCSVARFAVERFDPAVPTKKGRRHARPNAGCMHEELKGIRGLKARQALGGKKAAEHKALASAEAVYEVVKQAGVDQCTQASVARILGMARSTVARHWPVVVQAISEGCSVQYIVRKNAFIGNQREKAETHVPLNNSATKGQKLGDHRLVSETGDWNWDIPVKEKSSQLSSGDPSDQKVSSIPSFLQRRQEVSEFSEGYEAKETPVNESVSNGTSRFDELVAAGFVPVTEDNRHLLVSGTIFDMIKMFRPSAKAS
jgi:hypothetical protein